MPSTAISRPWLTIFLFAAVTAFFAWWAPRLDFRTSIYDLAVEDLPGTVYYEKFKKQFGSEEIILVVVRCPNVFEPSAFQKITQMSADLGAVRGVRRVIGLPSIRKDMDVTEKWSLEEFESLIEPVELFSRNFLSTDRKTTVISLVLSVDADKKEIIRAVENVVDQADRPGFTVYQIGMPSVAQALASYTQKDFLALPPITFVVILFVLAAVFKSLRGVLLPSGAVAMSLVWTFGLMAKTGTALSLMTMIVPVFLIAVGTAYCMHIITEYRQSSTEAQLPRECVFLCFSRVSFPSTLAVVTTVTGLASLLVNKIEGIREFAIFSCFGMISLLFIMLLFLPAVMSLLPLPEKHSRGLASSKTDWILDQIINMNLVHRDKMLPALGILTLFAVAGIFFVRVETNPVDYFKKSTEISQNFYDIYRDMAGAFPVNIVLDSKVDSYFEEPENLAKIAAIQEKLTGFEGVDKSVAFTDFLKLINYASNEYQKEHYALPQESYEIRMLTNTYKSMLGPDMYSRFMNPDMSGANVMLRTHLSSSRDFFILRNRISKLLDENYPRAFQYKITGLGMVIAESSHVLTSSQVKSLSITMVIIFGIMLLLFLSGKVGLAAMAVNLFPIIMCFGFMGWFDIKLSVVTSLIASIAIGLAVDDTIHYLVRYSREFQRDLDKDRALRDTIKTVGRPIIFTTVTISLGFSVLLFSHFQPTSVFGMLMVVTMIAALIGDLIFLPSVMLHIELVTAWDLLSLIPSLGGISQGAAHELRQPLNAVKLGGEYLQEMVDRGEKIPEEDLAEVVGEINAQITRAADYVDRLADLGKKPSGAFEKISLNQPVQDTLAVMGKQLALEDVDLELDLDPNPQLIMGHRNRLGQVVYNLILNSVEAIGRKKESKDRGLIKIRTFSENGFARLSVEDNGAGIAGHNKSRVMEPFFTTKGAGRGLGLGLSISREIVRDYGGRIDFTSSRDCGACFRASFPASQRRP